MCPFFRFLVGSFTAAFVLFPSGFSLAASNDPAVPAPIQALVDDGAQIRYLGNDLGMNGWVTLKGGQEQFFYATSDGQAIISGVLFNAKGDAVTLQQVNALRKKEGPALDRIAGFSPMPQDATPPTDTAAAAKRDPAEILKMATRSKGEQLYDAIGTSNHIVLGDAKAPVIYTFIDPECPHCHDVIQDVRKSGALEDGSLQLRLIPVGVLSDVSLKEASYLLASPSPKEDLFRHLDGDDKALMANPNANTQGVERNMKLMQDWKLDVTPFSVYKDKFGKVKVLQGRPDNLKKIIAELR